jgi:hypothetical protein
MEQLAYDYAAEGVLANMVLPGILNAGLTRRVVFTSRPELKQPSRPDTVGEFGTAEQVAAAAPIFAPRTRTMTGSCLTMTVAVSLVVRSVELDRGNFQWVSRLASCSSCCPACGWQPSRHWFVRQYRFENYWLIFGLVGTAIIPWVLALSMTPI